jgi:hypothetical protein
MNTIIYYNNVIGSNALHKGGLAIMTQNETIRLIEVLLRDIRANWEYYVFRRVKLAEKLCLSLENEDFKILADECISFATREHTDSCDGRYFRAEFPYGYEEMEKLYDQDFNGKTFADKSEEFKNYVLEYVTIPSSQFEDFPEEDELHDEDIKIDDRREYLIQHYTDPRTLDNQSLIDATVGCIDCNECPCRGNCYYTDPTSLNSCKDTWLLYLAGRIKNGEK